MARDTLLRRASLANVKIALLRLSTYIIAPRSQMDRNNPTADVSTQARSSLAGARPEIQGQEQCMAHEHLPLRTSFVGICAKMTDIGGTSILNGRSRRSAGSAWSVTGPSHERLGWSCHTMGSSQRCRCTRSESKDSAMV
jgi:hypothetical protein